MKNSILSLLGGIVVWLMGVSIYLISYYIQILENQELQTNILLVIGIIPSALTGTYLFYRNGKMKPTYLALTFVLVAASLDALITVPVFVIPSGGSYAEFFSDPMFYTILLELFILTIYSTTYSKTYFAKHIKNKKVS
tara:strand:+ start:538 stop:951 length:414 start_codon:yes stop_codon:yes gene_type:complete